MSDDGREILKTGNTDLCEIYNEDMSRAAAIAGRMPPETVFQEAAERLKAGAEPTRIRILYALSQSELCVCELAHLLGMSLPAVSHHLRILRYAGLIRPRKQGRLVFYSLQDAALNSMLRQLIEDFAEKEVVLA